MNTLRIAPALVTLMFVALAAPAGAQQDPMQLATAAPQHPDDPLARVLFPPELVMRYQADISLRPDQRQTITKAIQRFQAIVVELQWRMQEESQRLAALLDRPVVDQAVALEQLNKLLTSEYAVKREHIALLIQIKNTLTAEQQARLVALRDGGRR